MSKSLWRSYKHVVSTFVKGFPRFFKYQLVTQVLFTMLILPLFWGMTQFLMHTWGVGSISNDLMFKFLFSGQGMVFLLLACALIVMGLLIELCGFIALSAHVLHHQEECSYAELLKSNFKRLPQMAEFGSLMILLYVVVLVPLSGSGMTLSFLEGVKIPNFITSVIEGNTLYGALYALVLTLLFGLSLRWIFTFHFMIIGDLKPSAAMKASGKLVAKNLKRFLKEVMGITALNALILLMVAGIWFCFVMVLGESVDFTTGSARIMMVFLLLVQNMVMALMAMLYIPFEVHHLTVLFYELIEGELTFVHLLDQYPIVSIKTKPSLLDRVLARKKTWLAILMIGALLIAIPAGLLLKEALQTTSTVQVMAHRGGGLDVPENTLAAIRKSVDQKADWVEIDVQRTQDGVYVLNHDATFKRVAGVDRAVSDMTWSEIQKLDVGAAKNSGFKGERVPTLEQVLDYCKGRVKINIELKGATADEKMMDDVVALVYGRIMVDQVILTSLNRQMVDRIESKYPTFNSGFIFFMAFGKVAEIKADYLILEEGEATESLIEEIHGAKKKAVVWTVNTTESMEKFAQSEADAVITDDVVGMHQVQKEISKEEVKEKLYKEFFNLGEE